MTETFLKLYTREGGYFCFYAEDLDLVEAATILSTEEKTKWIVLRLVESDAKVTLRVSEIQSFYISTPEQRKDAAKWEERINKAIEEEPWK